MAADVFVQIPPGEAAPSFNPRNAAAVPAPPPTTQAQVDDILTAASAAADEVAAVPPAARQAWLNAVADALEARLPELAGLADEETALGLPRLTGELAGAARSLRFYGAVAAEGSYLGATIDPAGASPGGAPTRPDLRRVNVPLGLVAVFGASNFPFGFGVVGHDTASAIAAGCPVVVKAHPAHPRLSAALAETAAAALAAAGAPTGTFALVHGFEAGATLVTHRGVGAVGFTGSQAGGLALWRLAAEREEVIPVYAEMGTVNTIVVTRAAAHARAAEIAAGFVGSFTLGMGQFCTKPGLLLVPAGSGLAALIAQALADAAPSGWLLTETIAKSYTAGVRQLEDAGSAVASRVPGAGCGWSADPAIATVDIAALAPGSRLLEEVFGPVALVAEYAGDEELATALSALPGSLAAGVQGQTGHGHADPQLAPLVGALSKRCGRVVVNGWPTGVAVTWAQHHGGPWPATSNPATTSVGAAALGRWLRPVTFQDTPEAALPPVLHDANPWSLPRRVDGILIPGRPTP
jgi:NADP-dependent aldehyde dehydrogenase